MANPEQVSHLKILLGHHNSDSMAKKKKKKKSSCEAKAYWEEKVQKKNTTRIFFEEKMATTLLETNQGALAQHCDGSSIEPPACSLGGSREWKFQWRPPGCQPLSSTTEWWREPDNSP